MKISKFNTVNRMEDLIEEVDETLHRIDDELSSLENFDWDEIFEHVPNSSIIKREIEDTIVNIRIQIRNLEIGD
jgi:hypothetical protein